MRDSGHCKRTSKHTKVSSLWDEVARLRVCPFVLLFFVYAAEYNERGELICLEIENGRSRCGKVGR